MRHAEAESSPTLEAYLHRLAAALGALPAEERADILLEIRSHVAEQRHRFPSLSVHEVLEHLGAPDKYAETFLADWRAVTSMAQRPSATAGLATLVTGGARALPALAVLALLYSVVAALLLVVVTEWIDPHATGLFIDTHAEMRIAQCD
ncbi:MAG: hypothetical protein V4617_07960 [Gemmatimonadota bacterium]